MYASVTAASSAWLIYLELHWAGFQLTMLPNITSKPRLDTVEPDLMVTKMLALSSKS